MNPRRLATRVVGWQLAFSCVTALSVHYLIRFLFLLSPDESRMAAIALTVALLAAGSLSIGQSWSLIWARRRLLSDLGDKKRRAHSQIELPKLNDDPWRIVNAWLYSGVAAITLSMTALRPDAIQPANALTLGLFAIIMQAAASLPLLMLVRRNFVDVMEQVPPQIVAEIIDAQVRSHRLRGRSSRRLMAAFVTPVAFLAIGSALIAGAHIRSLEEGQKRETARRVVSAVLALASEDAPNDKGVMDALSALSENGYQVGLRSEHAFTEQVIASHGVVSMEIPLSKGSAQVRFFDAGPLPVSWPMIPVTLLALLSAGWVGLKLAHLLSGDLKMAHQGVRMLGTDAALEGTRVMRPARFRAIADLGKSIELLADRFRQFATAQEQSIAARQAATKIRGRFFASVSHDLKSPLNAILGFAELSRSDPQINDSQRESLDLILQRGRELLILIETILDAARVEAGQLHLSQKDETVESLLQLALEKAQDLTSDSKVVTLFDIPDDLPPLTVDRLRFSQAVATFLAHARRTAERDQLRILVQTESRSKKRDLKKRKVTLHIEVPSTKFSAQDLEQMLHPEQHPGQHRGLSLALRLAKSVIELHEGKVTVTGRTVTEPAFAIELRGRAGR
jgi:signal transduction histidine kinase